MPLYFNTLPYFTPIFALIIYTVLSFICIGISIVEAVTVLELDSPSNGTLESSLLYTETISLFIPIIHVIIYFHCVAGFITAWCEKYLTSCILFATCLTWHVIFFGARVINLFVYYPNNCSHEFTFYSEVCYKLGKLDSLEFLECIFYITSITLLAYLLCFVVNALRTAPRPRIHRSPPSYNAI